MKRRRFLQIAAGAAAFPAFAAAPFRWQGIALGAQASLEIAAPADVARPALAEALATLDAVEDVFSLYRPNAFVLRLNAEGRIADVPDLYRPLHNLVTQLHRVTAGLFDPTVQARWTALARGQEGPEWMSEGWDRVRFGADGALRLERGQAVTFNGIAQGYATDLVVAVLKAHGLQDALVNMGEHRALGPRRHLALEDPVHGRVGQVSLQNTAIATSSPAATPLGSHGHILHPGAPDRSALWSTVTVEADSAALADGLSTALVHADLPRIRRVRRLTGVRRIILVDHPGDVVTL